MQGAIDIPYRLMLPARLQMWIQFERMQHYRLRKKEVLFQPELQMLKSQLL